MASATKLIRVRPAQGGSGAINQVDFPVGTSQTIKMGDFLKLSSNKAVQALSLASSNNSVTNSSGNLGMIGVAMADITTDSTGTEAATGRTTVPVAILDGNLEVLLRVVNDSSGSLSTSGNSQGDLNFGTSYWITRVRTTDANTWFYAISAATAVNGELRKVENSPETSATEAYGLVYVRSVLSDTVRQF